MIIVNKDGTSIINFEQVESIFIGDASIKANLKSGKGTQLGFYGSITEAKIVMQILTEKIATGVDCIKMPQDKEIETKVNSGIYTRQRSMTGKKAKGHGGS